MDFGSVYSSFVHHGSMVDIDFSTNRNPLWNRNNFTIVPDPTVGNGVSTRNVAIEFGFIFDFIPVFHGTGIDITLTVDDINLNHNLLVCDDPTSDDDPVDINGDLNFEFNSECDPGDILYTNPIENGSNVLITITIDKNQNIDIDLCETLTNPDLNIDDHDFVFARDYYNYVCTDVEALSFHGSNVAFLLAQDILIDDVDPEHGHYVEFDISMFNRFYPNTYHGSYADTDFNIYPAAELDGDGYHGSYSDMELFTTIIFYDVDATNGEYSDTDLSTYLAPEFSSVVEFGSLTEIELLTIPVLQVENIEHGARAETDIVIFPAIEVDLDFYHGHNTESSVVVSVVISADIVHGSYSDSDLDISPSEGIGVLTNYHGSYGEGDLAYTPALDMDAYHGALAISTMNITTTLDADGYCGDYIDCDFTRVLPPELDGDVYHGELAEFDLALTRALFPRAYAGEYADLDLDDHPAPELDIDSYHGAEDRKSVV